MTKYLLIVDYNDQEDTRSSSAHVEEAFDTLEEAKQDLRQRAEQHTREYLCLPDESMYPDEVQSRFSSETEWWFESDMNSYDLIYKIQKIEL